MPDPIDPRRPSTPDTAEGPRDTTHAQALGHAIKVIRTSLNLGRRELSRRAGLSYSYLAEIENGTKQLSQTAQAEVARALGITVAELWTATEEWARALKSGAGDVEAAAPDLVSEAEDVATALRHVEETTGALDPRGARARQLRWFRDAAERRSGVSREEVLRRVSMRQGISPARKTRPSEDAHLETVLERIRRVLAGMSEEDRERVLDLAERLGGN